MKSTPTAILHIVIWSILDSATEFRYGIEFVTNEGFFHDFVRKCQTTGKFTWAIHHVNITLPRSAGEYALLNPTLHVSWKENLVFGWVLQTFVNGALTLHIGSMWTTIWLRNISSCNWNSSGVFLIMPHGYLCSKATWYLWERTHPLASVVVLLCPSCIRSSHRRKNCSNSRWPHGCASTHAVSLIILHFT